ncbi:hypothetical protein P4B35_23985, partial [Pontiellaceae bacterium B12227]|nr:hypothetical protein [Pontiellaceae bacterium B12227]
MNDFPFAVECRVIIDGNPYTLGGEGADALPLAGSSTEPLAHGGQLLTVSFGAGPGLPDGLAAHIIYEAPATASVLIKRIRIENGADRPVQIDGIEIERITPRVSRDVALMLENDYVRDGMTIGGERAYSPWIENHGRYIDAFMNTREEEAVFAYPVRPVRELEPGGSFDSFRVFE